MIGKKTLVRSLHTSSSYLSTSLKYEVVISRYIMSSHLKGNKDLKKQIALNKLRGIRVET